MSWFVLQLEPIISPRFWKPTKSSGLSINSHQYSIVINRSRVSQHNDRLPPLLIKVENRPAKSVIAMEAVEIDHEDDDEVDFEGQLLEQAIT